MEDTSLRFYPMRLLLGSQVLVQFPLSPLHLLSGKILSFLVGLILYQSWGQVWVMGIMIYKRPQVGQGRGELGS